MIKIVSPGIPHLSGSLAGEKLHCPFGNSCSSERFLLVQCESGSWPVSASLVRNQSFLEVPWFMLVETVFRTQDLGVRGNIASEVS